MRNSKSDAFLALGLAALVCGCDALRVPVPEAPDTPLRASFTGFVAKGMDFWVNVARPLDDPNERYANLSWIDRQASRIELEQRLPSGTERTLNSGFSQGTGLTGSAELVGYSDATTERLRGRLRWNASAPYTMSGDAMVTDSFDLRPQESAKVRFLRDGVRGSLDLRWPRLASAGSSSLRRWARIPDSLLAFQDDWRALSRARGDSAARILLWDSTTLPRAYRWHVPDTSVVRRILEGETAQTIFAVGDSVWLPYDRSAYLLANLDTLALATLLLDQTDWRTRGARGFLVPRGWGGKGLVTMTRSSAVFEWTDHTTYWSTTEPVRILVQVAGTCPAFEEWRRFGSTGRSRRPVGNVAPFDGYLCELFPDTLSFPRGRLVLPPRDTSTSDGSISMPTENVQIKPVRL